MNTALSVVEQLTPLSPIGLSLLLILFCAWPNVTRAVRLAATFLGLVAVMYTGWWVVSRVHPTTVDLYLWQVDTQLLGAEPNGPAFLGRHHWLEVLSVLAYNSLFPAWALLLCDYRTSRMTFWKLATASVLGWLCYAAVPACGPRFVHVTTTPTRMIPMAPWLPRNCFPSLHMVWALLLWRNRRPWSQTVRSLTWVLVVATAWSTVAVGEHYVIDVIAAFPFARAVDGLVPRIEACARRLTAPSTSRACRTKWAWATPRSG